MNSDRRRITLISTERTSSPFRWGFAPDSENHIIYVRNPAMIGHALVTGLDELGRDVQRVIIDHSISADEFLDLLSTLTDHFPGDILFIHSEEKAFLSSSGRGGNRLMYSLSAADVQFYMRAHYLVESSDTVSSVALA
ncbi:MAG TPA: hypothetical protein VEZ11_05625 [Thermoanaerobaculia bacterium]|nr:hypothetical protein [Thermoanaerobaculia bacterium]